MNIGAIIIAIVGFIAKWAPSFGTMLELANKTTETAKTVKDITVDLHSDKKLKDIEENKEYGRNIVNLAAVEAGYNVGRGLLQVMIYGILVWGITKLTADLTHIGAQIKPEKK
jgi:hypothetical protein